MFRLNAGNASLKRGATKIGSTLLAGILSATLAAFPSGVTAFAVEASCTETPYAETSYTETPYAEASYEEASNAVSASRTTASTNSQWSINLGRIETTEDEENTYRWPNLTINASDPDALIYSAIIQFTTAVDDKDEIYVTSPEDDATDPDEDASSEGSAFEVLNPSKHGNKTINATNGATALEWQEYLRNNLTIYLADPGTTAGVRITLSGSQTDGTVEYCAATGHYYELVASPDNPPWRECLKIASQKYYMGMRGYLATITSEEENSFIASLIQSNCWLGATDHPDYTRQWDPSIQGLQFMWVTGPEAGTVIPHHNNGDVYARWVAGEPNNGLGAEFYMHMYGEGSLRSYWNDAGIGNPTGISYIIEYGDMPTDGTGMASNGDTVTIDITLDPSGKTLSTSLESNRIEFGDTLKISENINGEAIPGDLDVTHTFYIEDKEQEGGWRILDDSEIGANGTPVSVGNYKVESHAVRNGQSLTPGSAKFTIVPKTIDLSDTPLVTKAYDGTGTFDLSGVDLSDKIPGDLDIELNVASLSPVTAIDDMSSAGDKTLVLDASSLAGNDADNYRIKVTLRTLPRELTINSQTNISKGYVGAALMTNDGEGLAVKTDLSVRGADAGADVEWLENELASCDGVANGNGMQSSILGKETLVIRSGEKVLDPENPEKGTYKVEVHYANVNPVDGNGMPIEPSGSLNVVKIDDWTYDIGNYVLTIKPATIKITSRNAGGVTAPGDGDVDGSGSGTTFAPIDATTDVRIDPSSTGTVAGDPYFEYESGKPVNVLNAIQVRPEGGSDWSDWMGGTGSDPTNPDDPTSPGTGNPGNPTNPDAPTSPGNPGDPSVPSNPGGPGDSNDPTNPDGSGSGDGTGSGSGNGTGTNPGGTTPQLPDGVKVIVTDECGSQVDPTNVTDPGTYEVTVSVKDPETGEFIVVETIKFHVVDTSITDTDLIYRDVPKDHWAYGYIFDIGPAVINGAFNPSNVALGYMAGYAGTKDFGPHQGIIRGDAAIVIWRMAGCPDVDQAKASSGADGNAAYLTGFTDCDSNPTMYWNEAIAWCAANGIVEGYGDTGLYLPQNQITREEFASIIARYAAFKGKDVASATADLSQYPDIDDVSDWAAPNMHYVVANGIMTGKGTDEGTADGTHGILDPQAHVTRAEVAKMTYMEQPYGL